MHSLELSHPSKPLGNGTGLNIKEAVVRMVMVVVAWNVTQESCSFLKRS